MTKSGLVAVVGKPNAGKSTLLNRVVGEKLSITSEKPQSTRDRIVGILTKDDVQMVILDTPGLLEPRYALQRSMRATSLQALDDADVIIYVVDAKDGAPPPLREAAELAHEPRAPIVLALNKIDAVGEKVREALRRDAPNGLQLSALTGEGVDALIREVNNHLPESPFLYPEDEIGTQPLRFFVSELVRETALEQLEDEVPYSVACAIEEFREDRAPVYIRAIIYVERESQKGILVGHQGARIRELGRASRVKIERLVGKPVFLDLWVKVLPNWRRNAQSLRRLGYTLPEERRR
jgi:GTP-binding protein Era